MQKISHIVNSTKKFMNTHSAEILTGVGVVGMISCTIMAVKATPKALMLIEERKIDIREDDLDVKDIIKTTWKCYIPCTIIGITSIACIIGATSINSKKKAALVTAYTLSETTLKRYQEKVIESIGEKKHKLIKDEVAKEVVKQNPSQDKPIIITNKGDTLCYETVSGRYFKTDIDTVKRIVNSLNQTMLFDGYGGVISMNDFYYELGLPYTSVGDDIGWKMEDGLLELYYSSILTDNGIPCLVLDYTRTPKSIK